MADYKVTVIKRYNAPRTPEEEQHGRMMREMGEQLVVRLMARFIQKSKKALKWCPTCPHPQKDCEDLRELTINLDKNAKAKEITADK